VRVTQAYLRLREEQRYHLDRILHVAKGRMRALGATLLDDPEDIRFLQVSELDGSLPRDEVARTVERRRREVIDAHPPDFLSGDDALPIPDHAAPRLSGIGVSPGIARGRTRVLRRPEEGAALRPGEILVAASTDPAWTPLFQRVGGIVLELGGLLSHGSVVAREYRVPAVCSVPGATRLLPDGTEVTLDGRAGIVWVHGAS
jgi:pyruvate,water dikinase